jgi:acetyl esterase
LRVLGASGSPDLPWFWDKYLNDASEAQNPRASPLRASDLRGLPPPALVVTAEFDPLRDEAERYGARLREAGVPTTVSRCPGMIHAFFLLPGLVDKAGTALAEACGWLRGAFAGQR